MRDLGTLARDTVAMAVNDNGWVVGNSYTNSSIMHAFVYDTTIRDLNDPNLLDSSGTGWLFQSAEGINNSGYIVGYGTYGGNTHAFLLTPVPEPATWLVLVIGAGGLFHVGRRCAQ